MEMETDQRPTKNKKMLVIAGGIVVSLAIIVLGVWSIKHYDATRGERESGKQSSNQNALSNSDRFSQDFGQGCKNNPVNFSFSPLAINDTRYIQPMGLMNDGHITPVDHVYMTPKDPNAAEGSYSVIMPADGEVLSVQSMPTQFIGDQKEYTRPAEDNRLVMRFSCRYYSIFIHVHELSPAIKAAVGNLEHGKNSPPINVPVKAGEMLAKVGANPFDWTMVDTEIKLAGFITPSLYDGEPWKIHSIDPLSIYTGDTKTKLETLSLRSIAPLGGKIDYDVKGTLIGNWFKQNSGGYSSNEGENTNRYYDGHLAIAPDYIDPSATIVSIGNWEGVAKQFTVKGKVDPAKITPVSGLTKFELLSSNSYKEVDGKQWDYKVSPAKPLVAVQESSVLGTILFEVLPGEKLRVEKYPGKTATEVSGFSDNALIYER